MSLNINVNVYMRQGSEVVSLLREVLRKLDLVLSKEDHIMSAQTDALDQAEAAAAANSAADDSAEALLLHLVDLYNQAAANGSDPAVTARIQALSQAITERSSKLSAAVVANTPAA